MGFFNPVMVERSTESNMEETEEAQEEQVMDEESEACEGRSTGKSQGVPHWLLVFCSYTVIYKTNVPWFFEIVLNHIFPYHSPVSFISSYYM